MVLKKDSFFLIYITFESLKVFENSYLKNVTLGVWGSKHWQKSVTYNLNGPKCKVDNEDKKRKNNSLFSYRMENLAMTGANV